jgi:hypothetical protein
MPSPKAGRWQASQARGGARAPAAAGTGRSTGPSGSSPTLNDWHIRDPPDPPDPPTIEHNPTPLERIAKVEIYRALRCSGWCSEALSPLAYFPGARQ